MMVVEKLMTTEPLSDSGAVFHLLLFLMQRSILGVNKREIKLSGESMLFFAHSRLSDVS